MLNIEKARIERLNEYKNSGVDGFVFVTQSKGEKFKNVNFLYVDINTVIENAENLFTYDKSRNGLYFRKSSTVDDLFNDEKNPIGIKVMSIPTNEFEKICVENPLFIAKKINKGGICETLLFNKSVTEVLADKDLIDGQIEIDGQIKNVQVKSSLISWKDGINNGCSNAELIKFKKGK